MKLQRPEPDDIAADENAGSVTTYVKMRKRKKRRLILQDVSNGPDSVLEKRSDIVRALQARRNANRHPKISSRPADAIAKAKVRVLSPDKHAVKKLSTQPSPDKLQDRPSTSYVGELITKMNGQKHVIRLHDKPQTYVIGRHKTADFLLSGIEVSGQHGRVHAITNNTKDTLVYYEDVSTNGTIWNHEVLLRGQAVVLSHGDSLDIAGNVFSYRQRSTKVKPPVQLAQSWQPQHSVDVSSFNTHGYSVMNRILGSGGNGAVYVAVDQKTRLQVACKVIPLQHIEQYDIWQKLKVEVDLLSRLDHPSVANLLETQSDRQHIFLFMDIVSGGDLQTYHADKGTLEGAEVKFIMYQVLRGLQYLHDSMHISHRDVKLENIILRNRGPYPQIFIADFGTAADARNGRLCSDLCGTIWYWAPEVFQGPYCGKRLDCWAIGVCLYNLLSCKAAFDPKECDLVDDALSLADGDNDGQTMALPSSEDGIIYNMLSPIARQAILLDEMPLIRNILELNLKMDNDPAFEWVDRDVMDLIRNMLSHERVRLDVGECLKHHWFVKDEKELEELYDKKVKPLRSGTGSRYGARSANLGDDIVEE